MATYTFKTQGNINNYQRTIIKTEPILATEQKTEFTLEQKESELANAEQELLNAQKRRDDLKAEIEEIKTALKIK